MTTLPPKSPDMADLVYRVILEADAEDGGFNVRIPAFPHAFTQGETVEEALANAREAMELEIEVAVERGEELPVPDAGLPVRVETVKVTTPVG